VACGISGVTRSSLSPLLGRGGGRSGGWRSCCRRRSGCASPSGWALALLKWSRGRGGQRGLACRAGRIAAGVRRGAWPRSSRPAAARTPRCACRCPRCPSLALLWASTNVASASTTSSSGAGWAPAVQARARVCARAARSRASTSASLAVRSTAHQAVGVEATEAEQPGLVAQHRQVAEAVAAVGEHHHQVPQHCRVRMPAAACSARPASSAARSATCRPQLPRPTTCSPETAIRPRGR
jgi:hypothetical protein